VLRVMFSKRANEVSNRQHYDVASTSSDSVRLSSRHRYTNGMYALSGSSLPRCLRTFSATRSTVKAPRRMGQG
jgi:hypothetical protein